MNDHLDDELASAYVDDDLTADERARVEADPALRARAEELGRVRSLLGSAPVEPADASARDTAIRAALDAGMVIDLDAARARRRVRIASIAAAVVLVLGAAGFLLRAVSDSSSSSTKSAAAGPSASSSASSSASRAVAAGAEAAPQTSFSVSGVPALGSFDDRARLTDAVRTAMAAFTRSATNDDAAVAPTAAAPAASRCTPAPPPRAVTQVFAGTATLDDRAVQIDVFTLDDGSSSMVVTTTDTCAALFSQAL